MVYVVKSTADWDAQMEAATAAGKAVSELMRRPAHAALAVPRGRRHA